MNTAPTQAPISTAVAVTAEYDFYEATGNGDKLFSVRGGIPLSDAFDQLSVLLNSSLATVEFIAMEGVKADEVPSALWQSVHVMRFSSALVQSMHTGLMAHERDLT